MWLNKFMSIEVEFESHDNLNNDFERKVNLNKLLFRLNESKKKERNSNIALSVAAVSAVTVFGIILSL